MQAKNKAMICKINGYAGIWQSGLAQDEMYF